MEILFYVMVAVLWSLILMSHILGCINERKQKFIEVEEVEFCESRITRYQYIRLKTKKKTYLFMISEKVRAGTKCKKIIESED